MRTAPTVGPTVQEVRRRGADPRTVAARLAREVDQQTRLKFDELPVWTITYAARGAPGEPDERAVYRWPGRTRDDAVAALVRTLRLDPARVRSVGSEAATAAHRRWLARRRTADAAGVELMRLVPAAGQGRTADRRDPDRHAELRRTYYRERRALAQTAHATATAGDATVSATSERQRTYGRMYARRPEVQAVRREYRARPEVRELYAEGQRRRRAARTPEQVQAALQRRRERDATPEARERRNELQRARRARLAAERDEGPQLVS